MSPSLQSSPLEELSVSLETTLELTLELTILELTSLELTSLELTSPALPLQSSSHNTSTVVPPA
jgi:hypothetical protein